MQVSTEFKRLSACDSFFKVPQLPWNINDQGNEYWRDSGGVLFYSKFDSELD